MDEKRRQNQKRIYKCPDCGQTMKFMSNRIMCHYTQDKDGNYYSGCGLRAAYNKFWRFCPYCGKGIANLSNVGQEHNIKNYDIYDPEHNKHYIPEHKKTVKQLMDEVSDEYRARNKN